MRQGKGKRPGVSLIMPAGPGPSAEGGESSFALTDSMIMNYGGKEYKVRAQELVVEHELGRGAYGRVERMRHPDSGNTMAVKHIPLSAATLNNDERRRLQNEVDAARQSHACPYMVVFYGAMLREGEVWICMEVMNTSLDKLLNMCSDQRERLDERILSRVAFCVLEALHYMKQKLNLMHRDVKPSNILINRTGEIKICDFGITGKLNNSVAKTISAGCKPYMAPERINPTSDRRSVGYDIRSDVWSLGITMIELADGVHPYQRWKTPFEQLKQVVEGDPPTLRGDGDGEYSEQFRDFVAQCLKKDVEERPKFEPLLAHSFIIAGEKVSVHTDIAPFLARVLDTYHAQQAHFEAIIPPQNSPFASSSNLDSVGAGDVGRQRSESNATIRSLPQRSPNRESDATLGQQSPDLDMRRLKIGGDGPSRASAFGDATGSSAECSSADSESFPKTKPSFNQ